MGEISMETESINAVQLLEHDEPDEPISTASEDVENSVQEKLVHKFEYPSLFTSKTLIELSNTSWSRHERANQCVQPYLRGCKWSPDGTCCLSVVNNHGVHVTELSHDLYEGDVTEDRIIDVMDSVIHVKEAGLIYDFCWYPFMNSRQPDTCCWLTTRQNAPIQMWDAFNGSLRCTYRGYNHVDEMEPAISLTFSQDGSKIIAGYKNCIRTFDMERPGREFAEHKIRSPAACIDASSDLLAVGSWNRSISLFNVKETGHYKSIGKMHAHSGGVTHVKFSPDGLHLVSGARMDNRLLVWDIRYYQRPLNILTRVVNTNQRIYFDISRCGKHLMSGGTDGVLKVWDEPWKTYTDTSGDNATYKFPVHSDCCNSISIHPLRPILATGSGQYHLIDPLLSPSKKSKNNKNTSATPMDTEEVNSGKMNGISQNGDITEEHESDESSNQSQQSAIETDIKYSEKSENSLVFWWIGKVAESK